MTTKKFNHKLVEEGVKKIIEGIGDSVNRPDTKDTPKRVADMYKKILNGYEEEDDMKKFIKLFPCKYNDMVLLRNVPFYSYCAHHIQPFFGKLTIAYIPNGQVLGISKLVRIARIFAKKLQLQEVLTAEIAEFLSKNIPNKGIAVNIKAQHMCMVIRGVRSPGSETVTSHMTGLFKIDNKIRSEFFRHLSDKEGY